MKDYLIIESGKIISIVKKEGIFEVSDFEGYYDTVAETIPDLFIVGEIYSVEEFSKRMESKESIEEKRKKMQITRDQADIALILLKWKNKVKQAVYNSDDMFLKYTFKKARKHTRLCIQTIALQEAMKITEEEMDKLFIIGMRININNLEGSLTEEEKKIFKEYIEVEEAKDFLKETEYKMNAFYHPYENDNLEEVKKIRNTYIKYIRSKNV